MVLVTEPRASVNQLTFSLKHIYYGEHNVLSRPYLIVREKKSPVRNKNRIPETLLWAKGNMTYNYTQSHAAPMDYTATGSFIQGARSRQQDWFRTLDVPQHNATLLLMGDGHNTWCEEDTNRVAQYFSEGAQKLTELFQGSDPSTREVLDYLYVHAAQLFVDTSVSCSGGSSIICCLVTPSDCAALSCGDSEIVIEHGGELHTIAPFDWDTEAGVGIATEMGRITGKPFIEMRQRPDALAWEKRCMPCFNFHGQARTGCVPETLGFIGGGVVGFDPLRAAEKRKLMELCAGIYQTEALPAAAEVVDPLEQALTAVVHERLSLLPGGWAPTLHLTGSTAGLRVTMASDGIRSKGCFPLERTLQHYVAQLDRPELTACALLCQSPDGILSRNVGKVQPTNPFRLDVLRQSNCTPGDPSGLLVSQTRFLQAMATEDSLTLLQAAYAKWLPLVADKEWQAAIAEQFAYFARTPTLGAAENPLEFLNRAAVLNLSDDNTSTIQVRFE